jgi:L-lactate utilization protein LutC
VVIGGPSRTADIEKQIVYGIHGPWSAMLFHLANEE